MGGTNTRVNTEIEGKIISSDELYAEAKKWADHVRSLAKANTATFNNGKSTTYTYKKKTKWHKAGEVEKKLSQSLSYKIKEVAGVTDKIAFQFPRHGVFRAYGVGYGQPINGANTNIKIRRNMNDWIDTPINTNIQKLADVAAEFYGDYFCVKTHNTMKINN